VNTHAHQQVHLALAATPQITYARTRSQRHV
jgi:hypothetical protein